jgi:diguanylate cyclase (GGDEF)-like protein
MQGWQLFLRSGFDADPWRIEQRVSASMVEKGLTGLRVMFPQFTVLTLFVIGLISVYLIRKHFMPLEGLMEGIERVERGNFTRPVRTVGNDEFAVLAGAFNQMTERIHRQIRTFMVLSMIDRGILARESTDRLIARLLEQAVSLSGSDFATAALADRYHPEIFHAHWFGGDPGVNATSTRLRFTAQPAEQALLDARDVFRTNPSDGLFGALVSHVGPEEHTLLGFPVFLDDRFAGLLALGFQFSIPDVPELSQIIVELGERVAVALSNAAWEERLQHLAYHDALTQLPNRLLLEDRLKQSLVRAYRSGKRLAVVFLDLDRFKTVNDSLGHNAGDALLVHVAKCLQEPLRSDDTLARLAGDEFIILLPSLPADAEENLGFSAIIQRLLQAVNTPFVFQQRELRPSASLGVAVYPDDGTDAETLLKNADAAMYHAKALGRGRYRFFSEELNAVAVRRLDLEADLHRALESQELRLVYQPKLVLSSGIFAGYEALVRWEHPVRGWMNPAAFLDIAEEAGMLVDVGRWVLKEACRVTHDLVHRGLTRSRVAVNLSAQQFHDINLVDEVQRVLQRAELDPGYLELEITEGAAMQDMERAIRTVADLKRLGVGISIDDFGTGYSSLSYLKRFEVDALKIDRSFIVGLETEAKDAAIVSSTILLAHNLGLKVIAEGVENENQLAILREAGCDEIQGYYISKPVSADRLAAILGDRWENGFMQGCAAAVCH